MLTETNSSCQPIEHHSGRTATIATAKANALARGNVDVVFVGDSILDEWRRALYHASFQRHWGELNVYNMAVGGNQTQHVLWQLKQGLMDDVYPRAIVLLIGTNNLGPDGRMSPDETAAGIQAVVDSLSRRDPDAILMLLHLLPSEFRNDELLSGNIRRTNEIITGIQRRNLFHFDLAHLFLNDDGRIRLELMPDALHPSEAGYEIMGASMRSAINWLLRRIT